MSDFKSLSIKKKIQETPTSVSLVFDVPKSEQENFKFIPGQFLTIKTIIEGEEVRRAYSISSNSENEDLQISVKKIADGKFSTFANDVLKEGDLLEVMIPEGRFQLKPDGNASRNYIAFAAGSGITPIMAMIKAVLAKEEKSHFALIYGNRTNEETMFFRQLLELQSNYAERFFIEFVYSNENVEGSKYGRIDQNMVNFALKNRFKAYNFDGYYLCGPDGMMDTVEGALKQNNIPAEKIHVERFTASESTALNQGSATLEILVDDEEFKIEIDKSVTLLDNVLKQDIDAPYSCKGGVCASCICRVTEGEVDIPENNLLTDDEIEEGLILACQSYAKSDIVKIDFDDA